MEHCLWRPLEFDHDLRSGDGQPFTRADIKEDTRPAPGFDMKPHRGEGLNLRVRRNTLFIAIAAELAPNHVCRSQRLDGFEQANLFIAHGFGITADRSVHGEQYQYLQ